MIGEIESKDKWFQDRWGKFTASQIYKLLVGGKAGEMFGAGAKAYIKQVAIQKETVFWENPKLEFVKPILWGRRYEQPAFDAYQTATKNVSMRYFGTENPLFLEYDKDSGGSPDGIMGEGTDIYWGLEIKCPASTETHWDYLKMTNQHHLEDYCIEYYAQMQFLIMITKANGWHFCSFDERFKDPNKRLKIIEVKPDARFQQSLELRVKQAIKERDKLLI